MSPAEIVALYMKREAEAGGIPVADPKRVAEGVAYELEVPYETVREALMDAWTGGASG